MHTGDLAVMDEDWYLAITGRIKDMVIRGGENVYPREIEEFLYTHPDILDAQVIGVPDAKYGEELMAWVRLRPGASPLTADDLRAFCSGQLAHYKIPRYVHIVDEFPMTVTGEGTQGRDARAVGGDPRPERLTGSPGQRSDMQDGVYYFAVFDSRGSRERPTTVVRRTCSSSGLMSDDALTPDLAWVGSTILIDAEHGESADKFALISDDEANQIIERIRTTPAD
jgi:hypothetical protein